MSTGERKTILLVEDEAIIALATAATVRGFGHDVLTAIKGEEAVGIVAADPRIALVLMDIDLGSGLSGPEAAARILASRSLPIVFLTSHSEREMVEKVRGITRYGYVIKNSGNFVLRSSIEMAFELYDAHREAEAKMRELEESEEKYRAAFMTSPDSVNINAMDGTFIDINEGFTQLTGYTRADVIGAKSTEIGIWARPEDRELLVAGLRARGVVENLESLFRCKDRSSRTAIMSARIVSLKGIPHILSITRDITARKAAENALRESEESYKVLFDQSLVAKCIADAETGTILDCNRRMLELTGRTRQELIGEPRSILHPSVPGNGPSTFDLHREGRFRNRLEDRILRPDGEVRDVEIAATEYLFRGKRSLVGEFNDITDRKRAERALGEETTRYAHLFQSLPAAVLVVDQEDRMLECNSEFTKLFGFEPRECLGMAANDILVPPELEAEGHGLTAMVPLGERVYLETQRLRKDGTRIQVAITGAPLKIGKDSLAFVIYQDIGERVSAQEALRRQVLALSAPLDQPLSIAFTDLFSISDLQRIQDEFARTMSVASIITDPQGRPITQASNFCRLCSGIIRKTEVGLSNCFASDAAIGRYDPDGPIVSPCLSGGLWDAGASITVGGRHVANWLIGQVRNEELDEAAMLRYADMIGADREEFGRALAEVPVMGRERFGKIADFLFLLANELSQRAYQNVQQARFIHERRKAELELEAREAELEACRAELAAARSPGAGPRAAKPA